MQKNIPIPNKKETAEETTSGQKKPLKGLRTFQNDLLEAQKEKQSPVKNPNEKSGDVKSASNEYSPSAQSNQNHREKVVLKIIKAPSVPKPHYKTDVGIIPPIKTEVATAQSRREEEIKRAEEERKKIKEAEELKKREEEEALEKKEKEKKEKEEYLQEEIEKIRKEKIEIEKKLTGFKTEERRLGSEKEILETEKTRKDELLRPIVEREAIIDKEIEEVEKKEALAASIEERRVFEENRWALEEKRRGVEREKWGVEKELEKTNALIKEKISSLDNIVKQKSSLELRLMELGKEDEKRKLSQQLKEISEIKKVVEVEWINLNDKKGELEEILKPVMEKETAIESAKKLIDEKARNASSTEEQRGIEQKRWGIEEERKSAEQKRWEIESQISDITKKIEVLKPKYQEALAQEERMQKKLTEFS